MLAQVGMGGLESAVLFGSTAVAMEVAMNRGFISRFPE
jgi:hypothetical protein